MTVVRRLYRSIAEGIADMCKGDDEPGTRVEFHALDCMVRVEPGDDGRNHSVGCTCGEATGFDASEVGAVGKAGKA